jgi:hypothetical protein
MALKVGDRVRALRNTPDCANDHSGKIGVVVEVGAYKHKPAARITMHDFHYDFGLGLWFYLPDLELLQLPEGQHYCLCGTITTNSNGKCCECKTK